MPPAKLLQLTTANAGTLQRVIIYPAGIRATISGHDDSRCETDSLPRPPNLLESVFDAQISNFRIADQNEAAGEADAIACTS